MSGESEYLIELNHWRQETEDSLRSENSWLALAGLHWLQEGETRIGSDPSSDAVLPGSAPPDVGTLEVSSTGVCFHAACSPAPTLDGQEIREADLRPDTEDDPSLLELGPLAMLIIRRGKRWGLRVWDNSRVERREFPGRRWFRPDRRFQTEAQFETVEAGRKILVPNETGMATEEPVAGLLRFPLKGRQLQLVALPRGKGKLFLIFADITSGNSTYGPGRFLLADAPLDGRTLLDFNYAYNPPCAFTAFATCPLPPAGNRLDVKVEAGELAPGS